MAMLEVSDCGIGIAAEDLPTFSSAFAEPQKIDRKKIDDWGLGLAIAESIVRRHGGEIELESTPGAGSTAQVFLPIR
jgi:signal transduction histidine kinase